MIRNGINGSSPDKQMRKMKYISCSRRHGYLMMIECHNVLIIHPTFSFVKRISFETKEVHDKILGQ